MILNAKKKIKKSTDVKWRECIIVDKFCAAAASPRLE